MHGAERHFTFGLIAWLWYEIPCFSLLSKLFSKMRDSFSAPWWAMERPREYPRTVVALFLRESNALNAELLAMVSVSRVSALFSQLFRSQARVDSYILEEFGRS